MRNRENHVHSEIQTQLAKVKTCLQVNPHLRDDVESLIMCIWRDELQEAGYNISKTSIETLFRIIIGQQNLSLFNKRLSNSWSIRRCWQKVQQDCPELRGKEWNERHKIKEPEYRAEMREKANC